MLALVRDPWCRAEGEGAGPGPPFRSLCVSSKATASRLRVSSIFLAITFAAPVEALCSILCTVSDCCSNSFCSQSTGALGAACLTLQACLIECTASICCPSHSFSYYWPTHHRVLPKRIESTHCNCMSTMPLQTGDISLARQGSINR